MSTLTLELSDDFAALLHGLNPSAEQSARELMTLELYRRGAVSGGRAAELLNMERGEFLHYASRLGIAVFSMTAAEWDVERAQADAL